MTEVTLHLENTAITLYQKIADTTGLTLEQVLSDALFRLAGELSLRSLRNLSKNP